MIVVWEKFAKVLTNVGNLMENFKSFSDNFNKNLEKFNKNLKFFLFIDFHSLSSKKFVFEGNDPPSGAASDCLAESQEGLASDITIRQGFRNISCLLILLLTS